MNHFDEFSNFIGNLEWASIEFKTELLRKLNAAMSDAYERGKQAALDTHVCHIDDPLTKKSLKMQKGVKGLTTAEKARIQKIARRGEIINAIKLCRELCFVGLFDAKKFVEKIRDQRKTF